MMKFKLLLLVLFTSLSYATPLIIDDNSSNVELLSHSFVYKDYTKSLTIEEIQKNNIKFQPISQSRLSFGYSPDFDVWIKFTLQNKSDKAIEKIIEYANPLTTHIDFFYLSTKNILKDGFFHINQNIMRIKAIK